MENFKIIKLSISVMNTFSKEDFVKEKDKAMDSSKRSLLLEVVLLDI